ncbi:MAG: response regulator transcription factor [Rhodocyclaceae bacterium]|nr:response regulator transcription factor [Rhodocyclaceae bacterium]
MNRNAPVRQSPRPLDIIVVDDEPALRDILAAGLAHFGHRVRGANDGAELDALLSAAPADTVILDVGLPGENGYEIAARLRQSWRGGIVMATAWGDIDRRVHGLNVGADAYLVKPLDLRELAAVLESLARRLLPPAQSPWRLDTSRSVLHTPAGVAIPLTAHEYLFLAPLVRNLGENIARSILFQRLAYPDSRHGDLRLEALVSRLRAKVRRLAPLEPLPVQGRTNLGYAFLAAPAGD